MYLYHCVAPWSLGCYRGLQWWLVQDLLLFFDKLALTVPQRWPLAFGECCCKDAPEDWIWLSSKGKSENEEKGKGPKIVCSSCLPQNARVCCQLLITQHCHDYYLCHHDLCFISLPNYMAGQIILKVNDLSQDRREFLVSIKNGQYLTAFFPQGLKAGFCWTSPRIFGLYLVIYGIR